MMWRSRVRSVSAVSLCFTASGMQFRLQVLVGQDGEALGGDAGHEATLLGVGCQLSRPCGEPAVAEVSLALVCCDPQGESGVVPAAMGAIGYFISNQAVFFFTAALCVPTLIALSYIKDDEVDPTRAHGGVPDKSHGELASEWGFIRSIAGNSRYCGTTQSRAGSSAQAETTTPASWPVTWEKVPRRPWRWRLNARSSTRSGRSGGPPW